MESYISCIKVRGMPILPPLMTDDRRMEMNYYKKLAQAVEDKLSKLKISNDAITNNSESNDDESHRINDDTTSGIQHADQQSNASTMTTMSARHASFQNKITSESTDGGCKATSDDETPTISTDINKFMNNSDSMKTDVTETISDFIKPNVPKTLDIIPITVEISNLSTNRELSSETEVSEEEIPKLIRQGSYTLDTPSPILLAHFEHSNENYIPTPITNGMRRRIWNSMDDKVKWVYQKNEKNQISPNVRRNSLSGCDNGNEKEFAHERNEPSASAKRRIVRSVDCIPTMFSREYSKRPFKDNKKYMPIDKSSSSDKCRNSDNQTWNTNKISPNVYSANSFSGSFDAISNQNIPRDKKKSKLNNKRMTQSFDASSTPKHELERSPEKLKPIIVSEKLVHVFKEIQKTHERQMADLMARQQKEQTLMQQEFQKQQLILLSKIEKTFPGVALPLLAKKISASSIHNNLKGQKSSPYNSISLPKSIEQNDSQSSTKCSDYLPNRSDPETSPINGSSFESDESISLNCNGSAQVRSLAELKMSPEKRRCNVSRELFPLESNTINVPVTNGFIYNERHIQAATVINAYAQGYLIRRLMKTERVTTLKNTYREALHCMLKLHIDAPLQLPELNFHKRLQHQCDAASISIVELFAQNPAKKMEIIAQDRQIKKARQERPSSARSSYSFATQRTLARKRFKEMGITQMPESSRSTCSARTRCQTWTSNPREKRSPGIINQGIKRSTSAGAVRKPWR